MKMIWQRLKKVYVALLFVLVLLSLYHLIFSKRIIPGVTVGNISLGGKTYDQAYQILSQKLEPAPKSLTVTYNGKSYVFDLGNAGFVYKIDSTISRAFEVGRTGNTYIDSKDKLAGLIKSLYIPLQYELEGKPLSLFISNVQAEVNNYGNDASYIIDGVSLKILPESLGKKVDDTKLYSLIINALDMADTRSILVPVVDDKPEIKSADLQNLLKKAEDIVFAPSSLVYSDKTWTLTPAQKLDFIEYSPKNNDLVFDRIAFMTYLDTIGVLINKFPKAEVSVDSSNRVTALRVTTPGIAFDAESTREAFEKDFFSKKEVTDLVTKEVSGDLKFTDYGIYALLGEGRSKFTGSAQGRINNLVLAASRIDGTLVPPGATFSMNETIGEVSAATGYDAAWIILGNRTVLGHGGGVCQTSTTLFRAALNAGLSIVERNPHAYRVMYYELESPVGLDASIYSPSLDLKFRNDTPNYILLDASWNLDDKSLVFKIYGTPDGRIVEMTEPVIYSQTPPPAPLYQNDPSLPKGVVRQVDFAAWGAKVSFTRKVTRNGELLYSDVFNTNYQPWRAVYLVGTK